MTLLSERRRSARPGFTLIEVVLAIGLTIGLMLIVLFFYDQASRLRSDLLVQSERVTAARLLLERLTRELRAARPDSFLLMGMNGTSNTIEFISAGWTAPSRWQGEEEQPVALASDLKIIRYRLAYGNDRTNAIGIKRAEEGLLELPAAAEDGQPTEPPSGQLMTDQLRFFSLRYWDGTKWADNWNGLELPAGVEVTLGREAPLEGEVDGDELYRRIIYLPSSGPSSTPPKKFDLVEEPQEEEP